MLREREKEKETCCIVQWSTIKIFQEQDEDPESASLKWEKGSTTQDPEPPSAAEGPVDFTIKSEETASPPSPRQPPPASTPTTDLTDMAAFLATAAAAVRTANQMQVWVLCEENVFLLIFDLVF